MNNSASPSAARRHEPHSVALQDMRPYALGTELLDDELLIVENLAQLPADSQAVQTSFFTVGYCTAGTADFVLNDRAFHVEPGDLFLSFGQQTFSEIHFSADFAAQAIFQSLSFVQETLMSMTQLWPYLLSLMEQPVLSLDHEERQLVLSDYRALHARLLDSEHCFAREVIKTCLQSFYLDLCQLLERRGARRENFNTRTFNIFYRFMRAAQRELVRRSAPTHPQRSLAAHQKRERPHRRAVGLGLGGDGNQEFAAQHRFEHQRDLHRA